MKHYIKALISEILAITLLVSSFLIVGFSSKNSVQSRVSNILKDMTLDEKISQMIIPAIRTWNGENITNLRSMPEVSEALRRHQYGGVILFGSNIIGNEQITRLLYDLQENNRQIDNVTTHIPYLTPVDEEGGNIVRITSGTRMIGNMSTGATDSAEKNAEISGKVIGEELLALGFNTDFAPVIDVNNNPVNPVIGVRSFSDDPNLVAKLGISFAKGLSENNIIATYKHYPGHGDTGVDSHIGTPSVEKSYEEIMNTELIPFKAAVENGAEMIMTAHITYPLIDELKTFGDGITKGYYPATMSHKMITDILRNDLGFNGVVVTDALEMDAIDEAGLVPGEKGSVEYHVNIAKEVIASGCDILLLPLDMNNKEAVDFYDNYIKGIAAKVSTGEISQNRIDESVTRILTLKAEHKMLEDPYYEDVDIEAKVRNSTMIVGSKEHHDIEMDLARQAITLVKNDENVLPVSQNAKKIMILGRQKSEIPSIQHAIDMLRTDGYINNNAEVDVDYYYDSSVDTKLHYTDEMLEKIKGADVVIGLSYAAGGNILDKENPHYIAIIKAINDTHTSGGKFILVSENQPYDAAVFNNADSIVLSYMSYGLGTDPTDKTDSGSGMKATNANIIAAIETIFGANNASGHLPVDIPAVKENSDGTLTYEDTVLYKRGFNITN